MCQALFATTPALKNSHLTGFSNSLTRYLSTDAWPSRTLCHACYLPGFCQELLAVKESLIKFRNLEARIAKPNQERVQPAELVSSQFSSA
jgi:hypothetical protein